MKKLIPALALLLILSGCIEDNLKVNINLKEINCTISEITVDVRVLKPAEVKIFTSKGQKSLWVETTTTYSYFIDNKKKSESILVTAGAEDFRKVLNLPSCACILIDTETVWDSPNLVFRILGIQDATVTITANNLEKTTTVKAGETANVTFDFSDNKPPKVTGTVEAESWCEQSFEYSLTLPEEMKIMNGDVRYIVGEMIDVNKRLNISGGSSGFAFLVGDVENLTVFTDDSPATYELNDGAIYVYEKFETIKINYKLEPIFNNSYYFFNDQAMSSDSEEAVDIRVIFEESWVPYTFDKEELTLSKLNPIELSGQTKTYQKVVAVGYVPKRVRIHLKVHTQVYAVTDSSVTIDMLNPKDTSLQTIENFEITPVSNSTKEEAGETYHQYRADLAAGEDYTINTYLTVVREAGFYSMISEPTGTTTESDYWMTTPQIQDEADRLKGSTTTETVDNVIEFVKSHLEYAENDQRLGASACYTQGIGACDEYSDLSITMLNHLEIPSAYVSGYSILPIGGGQAGPHAWIKVLTTEGVEIDPQESFGVIDPYRVEFYSETGEEKSKMWITTTGQVSYLEGLEISYEEIT